MPKNSGFEGEESKQPNWGKECKDSISQKPICPSVIKPVCGQTSISCPSGTLCQKPLPKTYSNSCLAENDNAEILYEGACKDDKEMFNWKYGTEEIYNDIKEDFPNTTREKVENVSYEVYNKHFSKSNLKDIHNKLVAGLYKDFVGSILSVLERGEIKEESLVYARNELYTALEQLGLNYTKQEVEKVAKVVYNYFNKNTKINLTLDDIYNKDKNYWLDFVGSVATVLKK